MGFINVHGLGNFCVVSAAHFVARCPARRSRFEAGQLPARLWGRSCLLAGRRLEFFLRRWTLPFRNVVRGIKKSALSGVKKDAPAAVLHAAEIHSFWLKKSSLLWHFPLGFLFQARFFSLNNT